MIVFIQTGAKEFETDSPKAAGKEVAARLKGMKDAVVRIVVEPRKKEKEAHEKNN